MRTSKIFSPNRVVTMLSATCCFTMTMVACDKGVADATPVDAAASATAPQEQTAALPDADITKAIQRHFQEEQSLRSEHVQVAVKLGIATISGSVGNLEAKKRALRVTETIKGVRSVIDQLTVTPTVRTDDQITKDVLAALKDDPATRASTVSPTVKDGNVTLTGTVDSWQLKIVTEQVTAEVPGIKALENSIVVQYKMDRPDAEISTDVKSRLANDVWLDGDVIAQTVTSHVVHLKGTVGSVTQEWRAISDAWVAGTYSVDGSGIVIDWAAQNDQRRVTNDPARSDLEVTHAITDAFKFDARLKVFVPQVKVNDGAVVLSGTVDSAKARQAAAADARDTIGVRSVRNEVVVAPSGSPSDADIERDVKRIIMNDLPPPDGNAILVSSVKGMVTLKGAIATGFERFDAIQDAEGVSGVTEVEDNMTVIHTPDEVKAAVEDRIFWDPMVSNNLVAVTVAPDGTITLSGTLFTWGEIKAAGADAVKAGANHIVNLLQLNKHPEVVAH